MKTIHLLGGTLVHTYLGNITTIRTDAVVNTGNSTLSNKQGLNKVILDCAGKSIVNEIKRKINSTRHKKLSFGDVIVTSPGKLACKNIIHTVSVTFKNPNDSNKSAVQKVVQDCLEKASEKRFRSLAFPAIGTGLSNIRAAECIDAYVNVLKTWKCPYPKEIHFVIRNRILLDQIDATFTRHFSSPATTAPQSRILKTSGGMGKTSATNTSGGSFLHDNPGVTRRRQTNHSAMASGSGAMAAEVAPTLKVTRRRQTNHSAMASGSGAMASEVAPTPKVTSGPTDSSDCCPICLCDFTDRKNLEKCGHSFCSVCIDRSFSVVGPHCPICQTAYGKVIGQQPPGIMTVKKERHSLPGFHECELYHVHYEIPNGIQQEHHPNPGKSFCGTNRTAYLPSNKEGETVLKMLQRAFEQKLIFTVGDSVTTSRTDVVTWNDIHHKTNIMGGPSRYGYPDPGYLHRVTLELEAKGIAPADVCDQIIKSRISNLEK